MPFEDILYEVRNGVAWITINRPDKMNAFRGTTCDELIKALNKADTEYRAQKASWTADTPQVKAIARATKADAKDVPAAMALYVFPTVAEQLGPKWLGGGAAKAMAETAVFLKEQGRIQEIKPDYKVFVTDSYAKRAGN